MIELFHGDDIYESERALKTRAKKLAEVNSSEIEIINADELNDHSELTNKLETYGMFGSDKVIIAKRLLNNKRIVEFFVEHFENYNKYHILIWHDSSADKRLNFYKLIKSKGFVSEHVLPKVWEIENWFFKLAKTKNINLSKDQVHFIVERIGIDKHQLISTLHKLFLLNKDHFSTDELRKVIGFDVRGDIWGFLDHFGNKNYKAAKDELERLFQYGESVQYILAMIARELDIIAQILIAKREQKDLKSLGLHPFVLKKSLDKAAKYSLDDVTKLTVKLMEHDGLIKSGRLGEENALKLFIASCWEK
ncbi:MAG: DNA polymerase III subunit delta [Candidatus Dojkabacteria bacterium]